MTILFLKSFETTKIEYQIINLLLRGYFTLNKKLEHINLISNEEALKRSKEFSAKHKT